MSVGLGQVVALVTEDEYQQILNKWNLYSAIKQDAYNKGIRDEPQPMRMMPSPSDQMPPIGTPQFNDAWENIGCWITYLSQQVSDYTMVATQYVEAEKEFETLMGERLEAYEKSAGNTKKLSAHSKEERLSRNKLYADVHHRKVLAQQTLAHWRNQLDRVVTLRDMVSRTITVYTATNQGKRQ